MTPLVLLALVAGAATAISPCVLPMVPVVLGASAGGGRGRPLLVVAGMMTAFVAATLGTAVALASLGAGTGFVRWAGVALLAAAGVAAAVPAAGAVVTRALAPLARAGARIGTRPGAAGALLTGVGAGLVWTPCAGPVLAGVTGALAAGGVGPDSVTVLLAYAAGAAVPLLVIAWAGRGAVARLGPAAPLARRVLGVGMVAVAAVVALGWDTRVSAALTRDLGGYAAALQAPERSFAEDAALRAPGRLVLSRDLLGEDLPVGDRAPEPAGISAWFNTPGGRPLTLAALRGRVVLVDFWTYSCVNCVRAIPHLRALQEAYGPRGLTVLGIHTPEFAFEADPGNVADAIRRLGVTWPVALDPRYATFRAWGVGFWPTQYLLDREGRVRYLHWGEGDEDRTERLVRRLLAVPAAGARARAVRDDTPDFARQTPETWLGAERLKRCRCLPLAVGRERAYRAPATLRRDEIALAGRWTAGTESARAGRGAAVLLRYRARRVFAVMDGRGVARVTFGGRVRRVRLDGARLYRLGDAGRWSTGTLRLAPPAGTRVFSFTFG